MKRSGSGLPPAERAPASLTLQAEVPQGRADGDRGGRAPSPRGPSPPGRGRSRPRPPGPHRREGKGRPAQRSPAAARREAVAVDGGSVPGAAAPSSSSSSSCRLRGVRGRLRARGALCVVPFPPPGGGARSCEAARGLRSAFGPAGCQRRRPRRLPEPRSRASVTRLGAVIEGYGCRVGSARSILLLRPEPRARLATRGAALRTHRKRSDRLSRSRSDIANGKRFVRLPTGSALWDGEFKPSSVSS